MKITLASVAAYAALAQGIPFQMAKFAQTNMSSSEELQEPQEPQAFVANQQRADGVREAFRHSWNGYKKFAFPHDELHPLTNSFGDSRLAYLNNWMMHS
jgi:hypothetical protein